VGFGITVYYRQSYRSSNLESDVQLVYINSGLAFTGTVLAVVGRYGIKKPEKVEKEVSTEKAKSNNLGKLCPKCGEKLPIKANFCNQCGTTFD
jgi:ribosomal protein L40E